LKITKFFVILQPKYQNDTKQTPKYNKSPMKRNFLPEYVGISMTKSQLCFAAGITPYKLRKHLQENAEKYRRLGYNSWDKLLMPNVIREVCHSLGLRIDVDYYTQYVAGQRGKSSAVMLADS